MSDKERRDFIKKIGIIALGAALAPRQLFARNDGTYVKEDTSVKKETLSGILKKPSSFDPRLGIVDLHSHPSLKIFLLASKMWKNHCPAPGENFLTVEVYYRSFLDNYVKGLVTTHHLVERATVEDPEILSGVFKIAKFFKWPVTKKIEHENLSNFEQICEMIKELEEQVGITDTKRFHSQKVVVARNYNQFESAIERGQIPIAHAIEGAHGIGRIEPNTVQKKAAFLVKEKFNINEDTWLDTLSDDKKENIERAYKDELDKIYNKLMDNYQENRKNHRKPEKPKKIIPVCNEALFYISKLNPASKAKQEEIVLKNLDALKEKGVCLITLGHFFKNDLLNQPPEGMAPNDEKMIRLPQQFFYAHDNDIDARGRAINGLSDFGKRVVEKMFEIGIIVDLTHTNPRARMDVFEINNNRSKNRPIVFSHSGIKTLFDEKVYKDYTDYGYYDVLDATHKITWPDGKIYDEIEEIRKCNGTIGIIPEVFFLEGGNTALSKKHLKPPYKRKDFKYGIDYMINTMDYIAQYVTDHAPQQTDGDESYKYRNISIGTDFDGLADEPHDFFIYDHVEQLTKEMKERGLSEKVICQVMSLNALRVLRLGWT